MGYNSVADIVGISSFS